MSDPEPAELTDSPSNNAPMASNSIPHVQIREAIQDHQLNYSTSNGNFNRYRSPSVTNSSNQDPFSHSPINAYSHRPTMIPPYVLDQVAKAHLKQNDRKLRMRAQNPNSDDTHDHGDFSHDDPFISALDNNWANFVSTVQNPVAYPAGIVGYDDDATNNLPDLSGAWGGHERLRQALASDEDKFSDYDSDSRNPIIKLLTGYYFGRPKKERDPISEEYHEKGDFEKNPKVRSKAGYWMSVEKRKDWTPMIRRIFLNNPYIPLTMRSVIFFLSLVALGLACTIFVFSQTRYDGYSVAQQPSTIMAISVQSCALLYLVYITYDEFSGQPIGLRDPLAKMRLILLDLLFIIFSSANLSLTFNTLFDDRWVCKGDADERYPSVSIICERQRGLASILFLILVMWVMTFTISIVRVVERVSPGSD